MAVMISPPVATHHQVQLLYTYYACVLTKPWITVSIPSCGSCARALLAAMLFVIVSFPGKPDDLLVTAFLSPFPLLAVGHHYANTGFMMVANREDGTVGLRNKHAPHEERWLQKSLLQ
jgi:hypothetical protein